MAVINLLDEYLACTTINTTTAPEAGGTWTGPATLGALTGSNPQLDTSLGTPGTSYTYTYMGGVGACASSNTVTIDIRPTPNAGLDNSIDLCIGDPIRDVFTDLNGTPDAGGTFSDGSTFDPTIAGTFVVTYTVTDTLPASPVCDLGSCPDASASVTYNVTPNFEAGAGAELSVCASITL